MAVLTEQGLYFFLARSDKPLALPFQKWIAGEVIPSIRKHGAYLTPAAIEKVLLDPDTIIRIATDLKAERQLRQAAEAQIEADKPKVLFAGAVATSKTDILVGELAKILHQNGVHIGQNRLFERLRREGYLCKTGSAYNMPTQKSMEMGLFRIKETSITHSDGHITVSKTSKVTGTGSKLSSIYFMWLDPGLQGVAWLHGNDGVIKTTPPKYRIKDGGGPNGDGKKPILEQSIKGWMGLQVIHSQSVLRIANIDTSSAFDKNPNMTVVTDDVLSSAKMRFPTHMLPNVYAFMRPETFRLWRASKPPLTDTGFLPPISEFANFEGIRIVVTESIKENEGLVQNIAPLAS
jgi:phage antirepressor YoqD-like protein